MKLIMFIIFSLFSLYFTITAHGLPVKSQQPAPSKSGETRKAQAAVSKSLYAKLKAQALNEARAELTRETEARERAKLEALQELEAGAGDAPTSDSDSN